jgi:uncharacterized membrane protein SirB2
MNGWAWVLPIRQAHLALVVVSGTLFALRGLGVLAGARWPLHKALRVGSVVIDTLLLAAGVSLWSVLQLNPMRETWLGAKLVLLLLYIMLGRWALKRAGTTAARAAFFIAALTVFATMVSIGWTRHPLGMWRWF